SILSSHLSIDFFFMATSPSDIYTLSLHDALPISFHLRIALDRDRVEAQLAHLVERQLKRAEPLQRGLRPDELVMVENHVAVRVRSEEHTSELQSRSDLVCRLLLEKKKKKKKKHNK